jgi:hypothetical protein
MRSNLLGRRSSEWYDGRHGINNFLIALEIIKLKITPQKRGKSGINFPQASSFNAQW